MEQTNEKQGLHILLVLTGGTIGTMADEDGTRRLATEDGMGEPMILTMLRERAPELTLHAKVRVPYQVLSEHVTPAHLKKLADCLREEDLTGNDGVLITHGSDTLAFTAAFLGELMKGCPVPVFLLAAQRPLHDPESNGTENALAAVQLMGARRQQGDAADPEAICVAYRNSDGVMYLHRAEELKQCQPGTDDFYSEGMQAVRMEGGSYRWPEEPAAGGEPDALDEPDVVEDPTAGGEPAAVEDPSAAEDPAAADGQEGMAGTGDYVREGTGGSRKETPVPQQTPQWKVPEFCPEPDVLLLHPYVGIRYDCISLAGIRAVVHTLYHSSTAPKELTGFLDHCREAGVKCYILPCEPADCHYETTAELLEHGAIPIHGMTEESAYMKLLMGRMDPAE
ncbi:MAG: asparaginase [Eubacterium sp.]|nr:asparaginase [Eubacterium sp.]